MAIAQPAVPRSSPRSELPYTADLDGGYVWLGITGAATKDEAGWDSVFGLEAAVVRVRERSRLGVLGLGLGGARLAETERWRLALDGLIGTRIGRAMVGLSVGPILDLDRRAHPELGATVMAWAFVGITPYARVGLLGDGTRFVDVGVQLSLPIARF